MSASAMKSALLSLAAYVLSELIANLIRLAVRRWDKRSLQAKSSAMDGLRTNLGAIDFRSLVIPGANKPQSAGQPSVVDVLQTNRARFGPSPV